MSVTNSIGKDLTRAVLWQYDNATNFNALIDILSELYKKSTEEFWDNFDDCLRLDLQDKVTMFGVGVWYKILGLSLIEKISPASTGYTANLNDMRHIALQTLLYRISGCNLENLQNYINRLSNNLVLDISETGAISVVGKDNVVLSGYDRYIRLLLNTNINNNSINYGLEHVLPATLKFGGEGSIRLFRFDIGYTFDNGVLDYNHLPPR